MGRMCSWTGIHNRQADRPCFLPEYPVRVKRVKSKDEGGRMKDETVIMKPEHSCPLQNAILTTPQSYIRGLNLILGYDVGRVTRSP